VEKKPLYHFYPGHSILSVGSVGCNLSCKFCQNWEISQTGVDEYPYLKSTTPEAIIAMASERSDNCGLAFTYNEPIVWYEFMLDMAKQARDKNLHCVLITNGFINPEPLEQLSAYIDAFNVDLKAFTEDFYKHIAGGGLQPVLESLKTIRKKGKHLEITNLVVTELNDDESTFREQMKWIAGELGKDTPFHISRYFPVYKMEKRATSMDTLMRFWEIASEYLSFVYLGNIQTEKGQDTFCPGCHSRVIERSGYSIYRRGVDKSGNCTKCKTRILGYI
jgi:pyruvate formate lyase activating enzyme